MDQNVYNDEEICFQSIDNGKTMNENKYKWKILNK